MNPQDRQLQLVVRKLLLGDERAQEIAEERGRVTANQLAQNAAEDLGLCGCMRSDGVICGRPIPKHDKGPFCWPCWSHRKDKKPCVHRLKGEHVG